MNCFDFQHRLTVQVDSLIEQLQQRKQKLLQYVEEEKEFKVIDLLVKYPSLTTQIFKLLAKDPFAYCLIILLILLNKCC